MADGSQSFSSDQPEAFESVQEVETHMQLLYKEMGCLDKAEMIVGRMHPLYYDHFSTQFKNPAYVPVLGVCAIECLSSHLDVSTLIETAALVEIMAEAMRLNEVNRLQNSFVANSTPEMQLAYFIESNIGILLMTQIQTLLVDPFERRIAVENLRKSFAGAYNSLGYSELLDVLDIQYPQSAFAVTALPFLLGFRSNSPFSLPSAPPEILKQVFTIHRFIDGLQRLPVGQGRDFTFDDLITLSLQPPSSALMHLFGLLRTVDDGLAHVFERMIGQKDYTNERSKELVDLLNQNRQVIGLFLHELLTERQVLTMNLFIAKDIKKTTLIYQWMLQQFQSANKLLMADGASHE